MAKAKKTEEPILEEVIADVENPVVEETVVRTGFVDGCSSLRVRSEASTSAATIATITSGTVVDILGEKNDFYEVSINISNNDIHGYCMKQFIK